MAHNLQTIKHLDLFWIVSIVCIESFDKLNNISIVLLLTLLSLNEISREVNNSHKMAVPFIRSERASCTYATRAIHSLLKSSNLTANSLISLLLIYNFSSPSSSLFLTTSKSTPTPTRMWINKQCSEAFILFCIKWLLYTRIPISHWKSLKHFNSMLGNAHNIFTWNYGLLFCWFLSLSRSFFPTSSSFLSLLLQERTISIMFNEENWVKCIH